MAQIVIVALLLLTAHVAVCQNEVRVVWSVEGVTQYQNSSLLQVPIGSVLIFQCQVGSYSNIIYQADRQQYEQCDSAVTGGVRMTIAECDNQTRDIHQEVTQNSNSLGTTIHYEPGRSYYFTSYSDGSSLRSASVDVTRGGECLQGLKLAFEVVNNTMSPTTGAGATGTTDTIGTVPPVVVVGTSSEPTFSSSIPPGDGGLLTPRDNTNIPIIAGAVGGVVFIVVIITAVIVVVVLVRCHSRKKGTIFIGPVTESKTTQPNGANKADLEKSEGSGVNKQTEAKNNKSDLKLKSITQKVGSEETKIDPEKGSGTNKVGNAKSNKPKPAQQKVVCDDSEIASEKGKLADANTTATIRVAAAAAKTTTKTTTKATTTKITAKTTTTSKGGNATNNVQGKSSIQVEKPESNSLKPAPPPPTSQRGESTGQPVSKKQPKQEDLATSRKKTGNRSEPRKNSSSADQLTAPSEHTNGSVKCLPPLAKPSNATKQQEAKSGTASQLVKKPSVGGVTPKRPAPPRPSPGSTAETEKQNSGNKKPHAKK